jgi:hypothetical protein
MSPNEKKKKNVNLVSRKLIWIGTGGGLVLSCFKELSGYLLAEAIKRQYIP